MNSQQQTKNKNQTIFLELKNPHLIWKINQLMYMFLYLILINVLLMLLSLMIIFLKSVLVLLSIWGFSPTFWPAYYRYVEDLFYFKDDCRETILW